MTDEQDAAETKGYLKYLLCLLIGIGIGAGTTVIAYGLRPIQGYEGYGLTRAAYNTSYRVWDYKTHQQICSFPVGLIPDLDSAFTQHEKTVREK